MKIENEFSITHEQFLQGMKEMIKITTDVLDIFKRAYIKNQDPFVKLEIEKYTESLVNSVRLLKSYTIRVENNIIVLPIIVFNDGVAIFGYRMKDKIDFSKDGLIKLLKRKRKKDGELIARIYER